jgi:hypothetical protein
VAQGSTFPPGAGGSPFPPGRFPPGAAPGAPPPASNAAEGEPNDQEKTRIDVTRSTFANAHGRDAILEIHVKNIRPFQGARMGKALGKISGAVGGQVLTPIPLQSGGMYIFFQSAADVSAVASALDLGAVETVDVPGRRIVIALEDAKVPQ